MGKDPRVNETVRSSDLTLGACESLRRGRGIRRPAEMLCGDDRHTADSQRAGSNPNGVYDTTLCPNGVDVRAGNRTAGVRVEREQRQCECTHGGHIWHRSLSGPIRRE